MNAIHRVACAAALFAAVPACDDDDAAPDADGGTGATAAASGGTAGSGGLAQSSGGTHATGGTAGAPGSGGTADTGGTAGSGGLAQSSGGTHATGGTAGAPGSGGTANAGGTADIPDAGDTSTSMDGGAADASPPVDASDAGATGRCLSRLPAGAAGFESTVGDATSIGDTVVLSGDGSVVAGSVIHHAERSQNIRHWFRWSAAGFVDLGIAATFETAQDVGASDCTGSTLAGAHQHTELDASGRVTLRDARPTRWTVGAGFQELASAASDPPEPVWGYDMFGVSSDGSIIVGHPSRISVISSARFWVGDGEPQVLPPRYRAIGMSAGGLVVGNYSESWSTPEYAFTVVAGASPAVFDIGRRDPVVYGVSPDGEHVFYLHSVPTGQHTSDVSGYLWSKAEPSVLVCEGDYPYRASWGARVIVGQTYQSPANAQADRDLVWDRVHGRRHLRDLLAAHAVALPEGWHIEKLTGMSEDARVMAGILVDDATYRRRAAFRAVLPAGTFE